MDEITQYEEILLPLEIPNEIKTESEITSEKRYFFGKLASFIIDLLLWISVAILYLTSNNKTDKLTFLIISNSIFVTCLIILKTITEKRTLLILTNFIIYFDILIIILATLRGNNRFMIGLDIVAMIYGLFIAIFDFYKKEEYKKLPN